MKMYNTTRFAFQDLPLSKWKAVNLALECCLAQLEDFRRDHLVPAEAAFQIVRDQWPCESDLRPGSIAEAQIVKALAVLAPAREAFEQLRDAANGAIDDLIALPAPSVAALAAKLEISVEHECKGTRATAEVMRLLLADARRLSGDA